MWRCGRGLRFWGHEWLSRAVDGRYDRMGKTRVVYAVGKSSVKTGELSSFDFSGKTHSISYHFHTNTYGIAFIRQ